MWNTTYAEDFYPSPVCSGNSVTSQETRFAGELRHKKKKLFRFCLCLCGCATICGDSHSMLAYDAGHPDMIRSLALRLMQRILTSRRNAIIEKHLPRGAVLIADVGCGHYANKFANVAMDKLDNADVERGGLPLSTEREGVIFHDVDLNVFPYPFTDKQFDYIICTHVLEHLADPVRACQELSRIG